jgi:3-hydroxy-9,10-secoandrosta-1,3,5(10)-triene-9,17-dione monooxygenase reductase component
MTANLPTDPDGLRRAFARFPTGVAVICAVDSEGNDGGMTANAICSLSLDPLLVLVCFEKKARTLPLVEKVGKFSISILSEDGRELADRFASKIPEDEKLRGVAAHDEGGTPVLDEAIAWAVCDLDRTVEAGDHVIVIGAVQSLGARDGRPLVWFDGAYSSLADITA